MWHSKRKHRQVREYQEERTRKRSVSIQRRLREGNTVFFEGNVQTLSGVKKIWIDRLNLQIILNRKLAINEIRYLKIRFILISFDSAIASHHTPPLPLFTLNFHLPTIHSLSGGRKSSTDQPPALSREPMFGIVLSVR